MKTLDHLNESVSEAITHYWQTRQNQSEKQISSGRLDQGFRSAVTGGAQMDGFCNLITRLIREAGADETNIHYSNRLELPGFFRPTKEWDLLVVKDDQLILALEAKSQVGPSFGNNFNNRTEEAMGSALDLWTAYREGAYNRTIKPWLEAQLKSLNRRERGGRGERIFLFFIPIPILFSALSAASAVKFFF